MTAADREKGLRMLRQARRLYDAAHDHEAVASELRGEAQRLCDAITDLEAGRPMTPQPQRVLPDLRH